MALVCHYETIIPNLMILKQINLNYFDSKLQLNIVAHMYENGNGIDKNIDKAIYWYEQTAKQGCQNAQIKLKNLRK